VAISVQFGKPYVKFLVRRDLATAPIVRLSMLFCWWWSKEIVPDCATYMQRLQSSWKKALDKRTI